MESVGCKKSLSIWAGVKCRWLWNTFGIMYRQHVLRFSPRNHQNKWKFWHIVRVTWWSLKLYLLLFISTHSSICNPFSTHIFLFILCVTNTKEKKLALGKEYCSSYVDSGKVLLKPQLQTLICYLIEQRLSDFLGFVNWSNSIQSEYSVIVILTSV